MAKIGSVLVIGAGMAGIQAAIDLADSGFKVYLADEKEYLGGKIVQFYRTFEDLCSICIATPKIAEAKGNPNITLMPSAKIKGISGEPGNFEVHLEKAPRYVDASKCVTCGLCWMNCPVEVESEFNFGLGKRKAIYMAYGGAVPNIPIIDTKTCLYFKDKSCKKCSEVCPTGAINFDDKPKEEKISVGAILFTTGLELCSDGPEARSLGLSNIKDVITNFQLERLISIYGPTVGELKRPSDGKIAKKVGIILCVDQRNREYKVCSSICCANAYRSAIEIVKKYEDAKVTIFYEDLCNYGRKWEKIFLEAKESSGIEFVKAKVSSCKEEDGKVKVSYDGKEESFDLIALSLPLKLSESAKELAQSLGLTLDEAGFVKEVLPGVSERDGIFVGATATGPKSLLDSVASAEACASEASSFLKEARGTMIDIKELPKEKDVSDKEPKIGVFICKCGGNISNFLDVSELEEYAKGIENVGEVSVLDFACFPDGLKTIKEKIETLDLNRVVVVACSFKSHLSVFQKVAREAGLNVHLVTMVNAREAIAWTNSENRKMAMERVKEELLGACGRARVIKPLFPTFREIEKSAFVLGGGISGMTCAISLAKQGFFTYLVEKEDELGGNAKNLNMNLFGKPIDAYIDFLIDEVEKNELIEVYKGYEVVDFDGHIGNFKLTIEKDGERVELRSGVVIIATGAKENVPTSYNYGKDERVMTQLELERKLKAKEIKGPGSVFMLQCADTRDKSHTFCSKVCCVQALRNALSLKEAGFSVTIGKEMICTPGTSYSLYEEAKEKGVEFVDVRNVEISLGEKLSVKFGEEKREFDFVVLSSGITKGDDNDFLSLILGVPLNEDGFFEIEDYMTITPTEFSKKGIFVCGLAEGPKTIYDSIIQAKACAQRAVTILCKDYVVGQTVVSGVDGSKCIVCLTCVRVCPFFVPHIGGEGVAEILPEECRGCGICAAACPRKAIQLEHFRDEQLIYQFESIFSA